MACAEDIDTIVRTKRDVIAACGSTECESAKIVVAVNNGKTQYLLSPSIDMQRFCGSAIIADNYTFDDANEIV